MSTSEKSATALNSDATVSGMAPLEAPVLDVASHPFGPNPDPAQLRREASALHWAAFGREVPEEIVKRYIDAHRVALSRLNIAQSEWLQQVIEQQLDLEALEFTLRRRQPEHALCQKFKLLIYITEAFPEYYNDFVNESRRRANAFSTLGIHGARTIYKQLKAWWLFRRSA